jgi:hypothetical protein
VQRYTEGAGGVTRLFGFQLGSAANDAQEDERLAQRSLSGATSHAPRPVRQAKNSAEIVFTQHDQRQQEAAH